MASGYCASWHRPHPPAQEGQIDRAASDLPYGVHFPSTFCLLGQAAPNTRAPQPLNRVSVKDPGPLANHVLINKKICIPRSLYPRPWTRVLFSASAKASGFVLHLRTLSHRFRPHHVPILSHPHLGVVGAAGRSLKLPEQFYETGSRHSLWL